MHRKIHKAFAFGFLTDLQQQMGKGKSVYDDPTLWTKLEIVVNPNGTIDTVGIVRVSGVQGFDVGALGSVMSAAPFEVPPKAIRSADGKVYLHWQFRRDDQACGTAGVQPLILTTPGEKLRPVKRNAMPDATPTVPEVTPEVRATAEGWFAAYTRGSVSWLAGWSATPFTAAGEVVARDADKLKAFYNQLLAEAPTTPALSALSEVLTAAGIRDKLGGLPPGGEELTMLYAVGTAGAEEFVLLLKNSDTGWRVCGVNRSNKNASDVRR